jgi:phosphohistidine phosphatase
VKTLFLLRHAKSSWSDESLPDFERALNDRGNRDSEAVGTFLMQQSIKPALVLSSLATRARATTENLIKASGLQTEIRFDKRIYEASRARLLEVVSETERTVDSVLLVGHNPSTEALLQFLTKKFEPMPTAALAKVALKISNWKELADGAGILEWIVRPKDNFD